MRTRKEPHGSPSLSVYPAECHRALLSTAENYWVAVCIQTACLVNSGELDYNLEAAFPVMGTSSQNQRLKYTGKGIL